MTDPEKALCTRIDQFSASTVDKSECEKAGVPSPETKPCSPMKCPDPCSARYGVKTTKNATLLRDFFLGAMPLSGEVTAQVHGPEEAFGTFCGVGFFQGSSQGVAISTGKLDDYDQLRPSHDYPPKGSAGDHMAFSLKFKVTRPTKLTFNYV
jgi:hypothetical protein